MWIAVASEGILILVLGGLVLGAYHEIGSIRATLGGISQPDVPPSRLVPGDEVPVGLGEELADRAFVVFVSYGCSPCELLCAALSECGGFPDWETIVVVKGRRPPTLPMVPFDLPSFAVVVRDEDHMRSKEFGVTATPTALAFVGRRLVDQRIGPDLQWFKSVSGRRRQRAAELLGGTVR